MKLVRFIFFLACLQFIQTVSAETNFFWNPTGASKALTQDQAEKLKEQVTEDILARGGNRFVKRKSNSKYQLTLGSTLQNDKLTVTLDRYSSGKLITQSKLTGSFDELMAKSQDLANGLFPGSEVATSNSEKPDKLPAYEISRQIAEEPAQAASPISTTRSESLSDIPTFTRLKPRNWYLGLGPVVTTTALAGDGTRYNLQLGYQTSLSEFLDLKYIYDANFNTASQGATAITSLGVGVNWYFRDRISPNTIFVSADAGYGGGNKGSDYGGILGASIGGEFFRNQKYAFEAVVRYAQVMVASATSASPNLLQVRLGVLL